jgi:hypothetical protein
MTCDFHYHNENLRIKYFTNKFYLISILKLFILSILAITAALWVLNSVSQTEESEHLPRFSAPIYR